MANIHSKTAIGEVEIGKFRVEITGIYSNYKGIAFGRYNAVTRSLVTRY
jgi:hypothetical protein